MPHNSLLFLYPRVTSEMDTHFARVEGISLCKYSSSLMEKIDLHSIVAGLLLKTLWPIYF